jgi:hypothetical protein
MQTKKTFKVSRLGLIADKELFRIWFEFYKLALVSKEKDVLYALKKSRDFYKDWGCDAEIHFDDWWKSHSHLFADADCVRLMRANEVQDSEHLYVSVPTTRSITVAVDEFRELLTKQFNVRSKRTHVPKHKYAPTEVQGFKRETARLHFELLKNVFNDESLRGKALYERVQKFLGSERYKKKVNLLPSQFAALTAGDEDAKRNVRRYKVRCKKILLNVAAGQFPGKY